MDHSGRGAIGDRRELEHKQGVGTNRDWDPKESTETLEVQDTRHKQRNVWTFVA